MLQSVLKWIDGQRTAIRQGTGQEIRGDCFYQPSGGAQDRSRTECTIPRPERRGLAAHRVSLGHEASAVRS